MPSGQHTQIVEEKAMSDDEENVFLLGGLKGTIRQQEAEIDRLRAIINAKLHRRKCHDCGHVGWYADSRTPYCLCDQCRSQDTRLVKEEK
jgi:Zn finger protein HypA/HybF involved in hydrogenase expression